MYKTLMSSIFKKGATHILNALADKKIISEDLRKYHKFISMRDQVVNSEGSEDGDSSENLK